MADNKDKNEIRLIKYREYLIRKPEKAFGYYCIAKYYIDKGNFDMGKKYISLAIGKNPGYMPSILTLLDMYIQNSKYIKAVKIYEKYKSRLEAKKVYGIKINRSITSLYKKINSRSLSRLQAYWSFRKLLGKDDENLIVNLLACMHSLEKGQTNNEAMGMYKKYLYTRGINDNMRWELLKILGRYEPSIYTNKKIILLFDSIPDDCSSGYANNIFKEVFKAQNFKIGEFMRQIDKKGLIIASSNLWKYVYWCSQTKNFDKLLYKCCKRLLNAGWVDKLIAQTIIELTGMGIAAPSEKELKALELYGYLVNP